jgi:hypothetical protein
VHRFVNNAGIGFDKLTGFPDCRSVVVVVEEAEKQVAEVDTWAAHSLALSSADSSAHRGPFLSLLSPCCGFRFSDVNRNFVLDLFIMCIIFIGYIYTKHLYICQIYLFVLIPKLGPIYNMRRRQRLRGVGGRVTQRSKRMRRALRSAFKTQSLCSASDCFTENARALHTVSRSLRQMHRRQPGSKSFPPVVLSQRPSPRCLTALPSHTHHPPFPPVPRHIVCSFYVFVLLFVVCKALLNHVTPMIPRIAF